MLFVKRHLFLEFLFAYFSPDTDVIMILSQYLSYYRNICLLHYSCLLIMKINIWHNAQLICTSSVHGKNLLHYITNYIINICDKLICVDKQRNSIPREHSM